MSERERETKKDASDDEQSPIECFILCKQAAQIHRRGNRRCFARTLESTLVYMCAKRMVKGSYYISPVKRRIIAVEWHDHTDRQRGRDERARRNQQDDGVSGKELKRTTRGRKKKKKKSCEEERAARRNFQAQREELQQVPGRASQASFQHYVNAARSFGLSWNEPKQRLPSSLYRVAMNDTPYSDQNSSISSEFADSGL